VPATLMAALTLPEWSKTSAPAEEFRMARMAQPIRLISAVLLLQSLDRVIGFSG
jgi:hypothetical protein